MKAAKFVIHYYLLAFPRLCGQATDRGVLPMLHRHLDFVAGSQDFLSLAFVGIAVLEPRLRAAGKIAAAKNR